MIAASPKLFGLFELDTRGTVMYSRVAANDSAAQPPVNFVGLNFFDEVVPSADREEFRRRFRYFAKGSDSVEKFVLTCQFDDSPLAIKVMLTQISEREFDKREKLIIVDIREV